MRVVVAGGGTAGHVVPALALAEALREGHEVVFVGTTRGAETRLVPRAGFPLETISVRGFDRSRPMTLLPTGLGALRAAATSWKLLGRIRADVVVGMGGYVSLPVCSAAVARRVPVVLHEQNVVLGLANRVCKPFARKIAVSFEETSQQVGRKGIYVGNPVASELVHADLAAERERGLSRFDLDPVRKTLIFFGGSQGARTINAAAFGVASVWADRADRQILHITGSASDHVEQTREGALVYRAVPFAERMIEAYAVADLAVCRGGATTVAELCVMGLPAIVVPYPHHRDRQQERHGRILEAAGAATVLLDGDATPERVATEADGLLEDGPRLKRMSEAARARARPDAAARLASLVQDVAS
jgi:UDP-N-acetylglucosamine--N-acetylmuramyl-(pentapeptide) pyrophosphoryl-undecaprenol N-acetylglucosamine transferase